MKLEMKRSSTLVKKQVKILLRGLAESHFVQTKYQHHQAGLEMEPTGEAEGTRAKDKLVTVNGCGDETGNSRKDSHKSERDGETSLRTYAPCSGRICVQPLSFRVRNLLRPIPFLKSPSSTPLLSLPFP